MIFEDDEKDEFGIGEDDFADDFSDDDFGDDFSDDLSEENVGFGEDAASDFDEETVVYDDEPATESPAAAMAMGAGGNNLAEYKKYIMMAFSITIAIIFGVLMLGGKKKPAPKKSTFASKAPSVSSKMKDNAANPSPFEMVSSLSKNKKSMDMASDPLGGAMPKSDMKFNMSKRNDAVSDEQFNKVLDETKLMRDRLADFQLQFESNRTSFTQLNTTIMTLEKSLRQANSSLLRLDEKMAGLKEDLTKQHALIKKIKEKKVKKVKKDSGMEMVSLPLYHLYAAVPGRAWLKSDSGSTLTIAVGSKIPGYGSVSLIEPIKGVVVTNTGHIFKFSNE